MKTIANAFAATLLAGITPVTLAQQVTTLPPVDIDSSTTGADTLTRTALRAAQSGSSDTAGLISLIPGAAANTGGGFSSMPAVHGLSEPRLGIQVDGHPIDSACPNDMNTPLSYTDPQSVERIRVITGVAPVSLGGDSIGAVITVDGPAPRFATGSDALFDGEVSAYYRSNGDGFGSALRLTAASQALSTTYTGSYTQSARYRGGDAGVVHSSEYAKTDHALALAWQGDPGLIELKAGYHHSPYEGFVNQYMDMTSNSSKFLNGRYVNDFGRATVELKADYRAIDHGMNFLADKGGSAGGGMPMNTRVRSRGYDLQVGIPLAAGNTLRVGSDYHAENLDDWWPAVAGSMMLGPDTYLNINGGHRDRLGAFGELQTKWSPRLTSMLGVRHDRVTMNTGNVEPYGSSMMNMEDDMAAMAFNAADRHRSDGDWSASALLDYTPDATTGVELGYAHKSRAPNLYERYSWGRGSMSSSMIGWFGDGNGYVGNLALKPEQADTISLALDIRGGGAPGWSLRLAPWYTHVDDYIDAVFVADFTDMMGMPTGFAQLQFANEQAQLYGVDLSGSAPVWDGGARGHTLLTGSVSHLHGQNLSAGTPLYHQMPLDAKLALTHGIDSFEAGIDAEWVAAKTRVDPLRDEPKTAGYTLLNLHGTYEWRGLRLSLAVENLLDRAYSLPLGGLSLGDYSSSGGSVLRPVPGRGLSVNTGISWRF